MSQANVTVTWDDQKQINNFGRLNTYGAEIQQELEVLKDLLEKYDYASEDCALSDQVKYVVGECFIDVTADESDELIDQEKAEIKALIQEKENHLKLTQAKMSQLKSVLYAKFGQAINLEHAIETDMKKKNKKNKQK